MINKQSLWFVTLFSLILVLGVYYVTMPSSLMKSIDEVKDRTVSKEIKVNVNESDMLVALRVERDEELLKSMKELESILTSVESTNEEKNDAFNELKNLNLTKGKEQTLEEKVSKEFNIKAFIKINNDQIKIIINSKEHNLTLANDIMRCIQKEFDKKMYISVKFQSK